ncbi:ubiquinone anaerobic biosynthesis accessory factor UbiT [Thiohalomonas denitrificans]|uniref:Ubiquinone biosynthesis accessory factor UbiT n=1 Tax=Thiohalomonas denitrificans TaxID=415747 RepID=A0A1G5QJ52_9GAMM|nr:SCP2 sterol-binding domain-containing protein [Thiohalomonas denitrificans]SCZ61626.1 Predicted lipid carrier protein YhbT, contains SCP2 domain [Thiohalomonas denitrificans]
MKPPMLPLSLFLKAVPNTLHSEVLGHLFNHLLKGQWMAEQLEELQGKRVCIAITDTGTRLRFRIQDRRFRRQPGPDINENWDVRISGNLADFWLLATRAEDPDTLFFGRRLAIEGETETGLYIKNMLDALDFDWDAHLQAVLGPRLAPRLQRLLQTTGIDRRIRRLTGQPQI